DISKVLFHDANALAIAKEQFPTLPWDQWAAAVEVKWDDLKDWAEWFERIENLPNKNLHNYGLPDIGVDYAAFAKTLRDSSEAELADKFTRELEFSDASRKVFRVVIEEGQWGGEDVKKLNFTMRLMISGVVGFYICLLLGFWIAGPGVIAIIVGGCLAGVFVVVLGALRKFRGK
ncbi:MAG TPA: hypothetical protein VKK79_21940, partial [Candidatus Lokiarchaeia archaeon]|nr:hypothetical protein [Candidatus Lokiarchaeia archaeon]